MALSISQSSDANSELDPDLSLVAPVEGRSLRATEVVYALFVLATGILLLATAL
jgi:hypothetical protein